MKTQLVMIYIFTASVAVMAWGGTTTQDPMAEKSWQKSTSEKCHIFLRHMNY